MKNDDCNGCAYLLGTECHRYPPTHQGYPVVNRGCGEYAHAEQKQQRKRTVMPTPKWALVEKQEEHEPDHIKQHRLPDAA